MSAPNDNGPEDLSVGHQRGQYGVLRKDGRAEYYKPHIEGFAQCLCFQTVAEMREGALLSDWGERRKRELEEFISQFMLVAYLDAIASEWARIRAAGKRAGLRLEAGDAWIAASASALGAPLLTHDSDFNERSCPGVKVVRYDDLGHLVR